MPPSCLSLSLTPALSLKPSGLVRSLPDSSNPASTYDLTPEIAEVGLFPSVLWDKEKSQGPVNSARNSTPPSVYLAWTKTVRGDNAKCPGQPRAPGMLLYLITC